MVYLTGFSPERSMSCLLWMRRSSRCRKHGLLGFKLVRSNNVRQWHNGVSIGFEDLRGNVLQQQRVR